ncbi:MAG: helix-turn-helix transcriptional regulator ['Candidatus Kapabacteria' thiocyanatum]|uniref:HTH cro/C1-type domain-containing protein n=1 Tax=Candidatus Kapaibacterium thiocyanatum TaxID=1895771 RepID=A0A1M3KVE5_9BACT|nr:helix-turn-helix transcriptional regulator ['Candidatus Kapabacteria' thiocyanatum]OJX56369.1 MAG: hypothetical protein BGO89_13635 ['Candidatus Kapabacteria' thiocyanatum]
MPRPLSELNLSENQELTFELALAIIIRKRRIELGMSQEEVADDVLGQSHISMLERGVREIGMGRFIVLARKLKMEPDELLRKVVEMVESMGKSDTSK